MFITENRQKLHRSDQIAGGVFEVYGRCSLLPPLKNMLGHNDPTPSCNTRHIAQRGQLHPSKNSELAVDIAFLPLDFTISLETSTQSF